MNCAADKLKNIAAVVSEPVFKADAGTVCKIIGVAVIIALSIVSIENYAVDEVFVSQLMRALRQVIYLIVQLIYVL